MRQQATAGVGGAAGAGGAAEAAGTAGAGGTATAGGAAGTGGTAGAEGTAEGMGYQGIRAEGVVRVSERTTPACERAARCVCTAPCSCSLVLSRFPTNGTGARCHAPPLVHQNACPCDTHALILFSLYTKAQPLIALNGTRNDTVLPCPAPWFLLQLRVPRHGRLHGR